MKVEISNGELIDKLSILHIKLNKIQDSKKLKNIIIEFNSLLQIAEDVLKTDGVEKIFQDLLKINTELWNTEDFLRNKEKLNQFDDEFILHARNVYRMNDIRFELKTKINIITNSYFIEEKSYEKY